MSKCPHCHTPIDAVQPLPDRCPQCLRLLGSDSEPPPSIGSATVSLSPAATVDLSPDDVARIAAESSNSATANAANSATADLTPTETADDRRHLDQTLDSDAIDLTQINAIVEKPPGLAAANAPAGTPRKSPTGTEVDQRVFGQTVDSDALKSAISNKPVGAPIKACWPPQEAGPYDKTQIDPTGVDTATVDSDLIPQSDEARLNATWGSRIASGADDAHFLEGGHAAVASGFKTRHQDPHRSRPAHGA